MQRKTVVRLGCTVYTILVVVFIVTGYLYRTGNLFVLAALVLLWVIDNIYMLLQKRDDCPYCGRPKSYRRGIIVWNCPDCPATPEGWS
jgi:hypothetical protein